jgi:hypothetical protein
MKLNDALSSRTKRPHLNMPRISAASPIHCFGARQDSVAAPLVGLDRARRRCRSIVPEPWCFDPQAEKNSAPAW